MKLTDPLAFESMGHPGLFAPIGESDWAFIDRPMGYEHTNHVICVRVSQVLNGEFHKESSDDLPVDSTPSDVVNYISEKYPHLVDLDYTPKNNQTCTRQVARIKEELKAEFGIEDVEMQWGQYGRIKSLRLPLTDKQWLDLANKSGELLPACCANISAIRDCFLSAQREDYFINADDLETIVGCAESSHSELIEDPEHPVAICKRIWDKIQPVAYIMLGASKRNVDNIEDAVGMFGDFCHSYQWASINSSFPRYEDRVCVTYGLFNVLPALKTINHKIRELNLGPIEGYAICPRHGDDNIHLTRCGLAVRPTLEETETVFKRWVETKQVDPEQTVIRPVKISIEHGIEFLETLESKWVDSDQLWDAEVSKEEYDVVEETLNALEKTLKSERAKLQVRLALSNLRTMTEEFHPRRLRHERP